MNYRKYRYLRLDGSSTIMDRRDMVRDFQHRYVLNFIAFLISPKCMFSILYWIGLDSMTIKMLSSFFFFFLSTVQYYPILYIEHAINVKNF